MKTQLPKTWSIVSIGDISDVISGGTPKASDDSNFEEPGKGIAWLTPADLSGYNQKYISHGKRDLSNNGLESSSAKLMPQGTVLFSSRAPIGYVAIASNDISTNQGFKSFVFTSHIDPSYAYYYLKSIRTLAEGLGTGTTFKELSGRVAKQLPFIIAPLNEQKRIADKLDSLLAKVNAAQARLDKIPAILKRFRQSVLTAATSGELTKEWRSSHQLNEWAQKKLSSVSEIKDPHPSHRTPKQYIGGVPYISTGDIELDGTINFEGARKVSPDVLQEHKARYQLKPGDFVFGKIGTLGKATPLPMGIDYTLSANVILVQPNEDKVVPDYLMFFLSAPSTMNEIAKQSNSTSQAAFGIKKMRAFEAMLPPLTEQTEIVRRVESLFTLADTVEKQYSNAKQRIDRLTQSILAKAFRGKLVAQDPTDEPASELLERIQAEREALKPAKKNRARKLKG